MTTHDAHAALVTGAGKRIGRAIALDLAARGWAVGVHHRSSGAEADEVVRLIRQAGGRAVALPADLAVEDQVERLFPALEEHFGPATLLVNSASLFERDEWDTVSRGSWDRHLAVNLRAPFVLAQALAARMPKEMSGLVVNILDQRVWNLTPHFVSYTVSKAGLWTLTQTLAMAFAPRVRVNAIGPGPTLRGERQTDEHFAAQCRAVPLQKGSSPEEICSAIRFLLDAPSMTGQMIALDGGEHLGLAQPARGFVPME